MYLSDCANAVGGNENKIMTSSHASSIVGGGRNCIDCSSGSFVGGGTSNQVKGEGQTCYSSIVGGFDNCISDGYSFIGGGLNNYILRGDGCNFMGGGIGNILGRVGQSAIMSGISNIASGSNCSGTSVNCGLIIGGGVLNHICGNIQQSVILGGRSNTIFTGSESTQIMSYSTVGGGYCNRIFAGNNNTISGGTFNLIQTTGCAALKNNNTIGGGTTNTIQNHSGTSTIGGGTNNGISGGIGSAIAGGKQNLIASCGRDTGHSFIGAGACNKTCSCCTFMGTGRANTIDSTNQMGIIIGGDLNRICGAATCSGIFGGKNNIVCNNLSYIIGSDLTTTAACTTYMNNGTIKCHLQVGGTATLNTTTGRIDATNDIVAYSTSDCRLKENIKPIKNALCKVIGVSGNTFSWKELNTEEIKTIHGNTGKDVGVIAQEIEKILPEAVTTRNNGYKAVNYEKIVPLLIEAIKEQQKQINELKSKI